MSHRRRPPWVAVLVFASLLAGCFEEPIRERMELRFRQDGAVTVIAATTLARVEDGRSAALEARVRETARSLIEGKDAWSRRFAGLDARLETYRWVRREGFLAEVERRAVLDDPRQLEKIFSDSPISVFYEEGGGEERGDPPWAALSFYPTAGSRATRAQRRRVEDAFHQWSQVIAKYLQRVEELYAFLAENPQLARPSLRALYGEAMDLPPPEDLPEEAEERVAAVYEAIVAVVDVLLIHDDGEPYSLDELSRQVLDPFPAPLTIQVPPRVAEVEGLVAAGEGERGGRRWAVPGLSLWGAFSALEGRWASPDPALAFYRLRPQADPGPEDLEAVVSARRSFHWAPDAGEVEATLAELLQPASAYRLVWLH